MQITGLEDRDILFMRFQGEGGPHCLPYFISLDHEKQAVVVSIRGTLSLEDAVTGAVPSLEDAVTGVVPSLLRALLIMSQSKFCTTTPMS